MTVAGAWLIKRGGMSLYRRIREAVAAGRVPGKELADAFLILLGGALMLTPGFVTDAFGIALLLPPVRAVVRRVALVQLSRRAVRYGRRGIIEV